VTVTASGFKTTVVQDVKVDVGQPTTVNATLETGGVNDQVVVTGGGEILQAASANVSSTITGRQIHELPFTTRDSLQLVLALPGVQTPGTPRASSVNGLPDERCEIPALFVSWRLNPSLSLEKSSYDSLAKTVFAWRGRGRARRAV
jgi:hypothetical protein